MRYFCVLLHASSSMLVLVFQYDDSLRDMGWFTVSRRPHEVMYSNKCGVLSFHVSMCSNPPCRCWYWRDMGWSSPLGEEGLVAPFLTSHPQPCTSRSVFYLPGHHLLLPSICLLVQLPPLFLYLSVLCIPTMHPVHHLLCRPFTS